MAAIETPPSPPEKPVEPNFDRPRTRYDSHSPHELLDVIDTLESERMSARVREAIWVSLIFHLFVFWWIFYGPKLKAFQRATVVNPMSVTPVKPPEQVYLNMPPDLVKKPPPKPTNIISDQNHIAQTKHPTLDKKTIEELQAMRRAGRPSPPPQPQQRAQRAEQPSQPAVRPTRSAPREQARAVPPSQQPLPSAPSANRLEMAQRQAEQRQSRAFQNQATSQPNMSVGDLIRQAERNAARSNGEAGDNGENAPVQHPGLATDAEILSDTMGVDFGPYVHKIVDATQSMWDLLIPEAARPPLDKQGTVTIQFIIMPDGSIKQMQLVRPSGDVSLDRAAWGGITGAGPFPPLPKEFHGPYLALRFKFLYNEQTGQYTRE
ncbi:MAG: cell envelope integrity protein TolA [Acidobacteriaceae bacterium]